MSDYFKDKTAVVTGAASGLGLGITRELLRRGAKAVFMGDFNQENLKKSSDGLSSDYQGRVYPMLTDVTKDSDVSELIRSAREETGRLDFLFNNAGMGMTLPTDRITLEIWRYLVDLNIMGVVHGTYAAIPIMREQGTGHIINTGSIAGKIPVPY